MEQDWFEEKERKERRRKTHLQRLNGKRYKRKKGLMTKKELKALFGPFGEMRQDRISVASRGILLYADKNRQLYDVEIIDDKDWTAEEAEEFLNQYRGQPVDLLV